MRTWSQRNRARRQRSAPRPFSTNAFSVRYRPAGPSVCPGPMIARSQPAGRTESEPRAQDAPSTTNPRPVGGTRGQMYEHTCTRPGERLREGQKRYKSRSKARTNQPGNQAAKRENPPRTDLERKKTKLLPLRTPGLAPWATGRVAPRGRSRRTAPRIRSHSRNTPAVSTSPALAAGPDHLTRQAFAAGKRRR